MPELVRPDLNFMASFVEALKEGHNRDTLRPETPESIAVVDGDHEGFIASLFVTPDSITLPDGSQGKAVPQTLLWWVEGDRFLGSLGIRHSLNETLAIVGGHVGYAMRPSERGKGHATALLAAGLDHIRHNLPLRRVLLTVNAENPASIRVIEKNGGIHTDSVPHLWHPGETALHYWIDIPA